MAGGFQVMGGMPDGYAGILSGAGANLVRMPDGSYRPAPQMSGPTSLAQIYDGILSTPSPSDPTGPGMDWGALTGMLDDPSYSGIPDPSTYGQPPTTVAQTRAEQTRPRSALTAIADLAGIPQASGTMSTNKDQSRLDTPMLAFNGDQATGIPASGMGGGGMGASGGASLLPKGFPGGSMAGIGGRSFLPANPTETDWSVANNGMQGISGPNDAKYLPNDPRNKPAGKTSALPKKYATSTAPGTFNRETGTWNTGSPASGALPNFGSMASGLGGLFSGGLGNSLIGHIISAITSGGQPANPLQAGASAAGGALPHPSMPMIDLNKVSPDSPAAGLLAKNGGGLGAGAQVSFRPGTEQRWLTGY